MSQPGNTGQFRISDRAREDLSDIWVYVAADSPGAADRLTEELIARFPTLARFPQMGRSREELAPALRSFVVGSYVIYYRPFEGGVEVVRVLHGARDVERLFRG